LPRNFAIELHDQGSAEFGFSELGAVEIRQKACAVHPTPFEWPTRRAALLTYTEIVEAISRSVLCDVLKAADDPRVVKLLAHLDRDRLKRLIEGREDEGQQEPEPAEEGV
jgi:hypothetical protein